MASNELIATGDWRGYPARFRNDQVIVSAQDNIADGDVENIIRGAIEHQTAAQIVYRPSGRKWALVSVPVGTDIPALAESIGRRSGILYAEPDFVIEAHAPPPNDPLLKSQIWAQIINAENAWRRTTGRKNVLLAVLDSGIPIQKGVLSHEDLSSPRFILHHGTISHDYVPPPMLLIPIPTAGPNLPDDQNGHGTYVTGVLAATENNNKGVAGLNWRSDVYVARVLGASAQGFVGLVKQAMEHLANYWPGNIVVNMSFGTKMIVEALSLKQMCHDTKDGRFILCCAPGFVQSSTGAWHVDWPARFATTYPHVISVGSSGGSLADKDDIREPFSIEEPADPAEITVVAPGVPVYSTELATLKYADSQGTSMACPVAAGVASLMWGVNHRLSPSQVRNMLRQSGTKLVRGTREYRRVNAPAAVWRARLSVWWPFPWP